MTPPEATSSPLVGSAATLADHLMAAPGLCLGVDFDGTLAPIRDDPDASTLPQDVAESLERFATRPDVELAVVSGRALEDLQSRVDVEGAILAGNHGLEIERDGEPSVLGEAERQRSVLRSVCTELDTELAAVPGCHVEDKQLTLTVHYRQTPEEYVAKVRDTVIDVAEREGLELTEGKAVLEIRPAVGRDKGTTMRRLEAETPSDWLTVFVGDDRTDEDAFRAIQPAGVGIHVGTEGETAAAYRLPHQDDVAPFLRWLETAFRTEPRD